MRPPKHLGLNVPVIGKHYIVRSIGPSDGVTVEGIVNPNGPLGHEWDFHSRGFRPVRYENVALFRAMCCSTKPLVPVEPLSKLLRYAPRPVKTSGRGSVNPFRAAPVIQCADK